MSDSKRPQSWDKTRRGKTPDYEYNSIKEIQEQEIQDIGVKQTFNLFGVVKNFRPPAKSRGSDYFCIFRIVDESYCENDGIKVTVFHKDEELMPHFNEWDIIRLHRVKPTLHDGEMTLVSSWGWSIVHWDGLNRSGNDEIYDGKSSSKNFTVIQSHKDRVKELQDWIKSNYLNDSLSPGVLCESEFKLENVTKESYFSMIGQVAGMVKLKDELTVVRVWDGTKPTLTMPFIPNIETDGMVTMNNLNLVENLMVDICAYDNHSKYIEDNSITLGSYILIHNLHCTRRKDKKDEYDLILHGGVYFDRGILILEEENPKVDELKKKIKQVLTQAKTKRQQSEIPGITTTSSPKKRQTSPNPSTGNSQEKRIRLSESPSTQSEGSFKTPPQTSMNFSNDSQSHSRNNLVDTSPLPMNFTVEKVNLTPQKAGPDTLEMFASMDSEKLSQDSYVLSKETTLDDEHVDVEGSQSQDDNLRCQQSSSTVVFGDSPFLITPLNKVITTEVPTSLKKLFRVRVKIENFSNIDNSVIYFCPATNLRIPAKNSGENIELSKEVEDFLHLWRRFRGLNDEQNDCDVLNDNDDVEFEEGTQWVLPDNNMKIKKYTDPTGNSEWQELSINKENVIHKLKQGSTRFNILYTTNINSKEDFLKHANKYDRVVRIMEREKLTGNILIPICYQDGIFYYCSPGCIGQVRIPSLAQESETFLPEQPLQALNCPLLLLRFYFQINISDQSGSLKDLILQGKNAIEFFNDITPSQYLLDIENCKNLVKEEVQSLITISQDEENFIELVIEKRSRKSIENKNDDILLYDIVNTRLKKFRF